METVCCRQQLHRRKFRSGSNYIETCENAVGDCGEGAKQAADICRAVLSGESSYREMEYPCHSPDDERWFILQVNSLKGEQGGAVISHINITARKKAEIQLKNSEEFSRGIFENSPDCVKVLNLDGTLHSMNKNGLCIMEIDDFDYFVGRVWVISGKAKNILRRGAQSKTLEAARSDISRVCAKPLKEPSNFGMFPLRRFLMRPEILFV